MLLYTRTIWHYNDSKYHSHWRATMTIMIFEMTGIQIAPGRAGAAARSASRIFKF